MEWVRMTAPDQALYGAAMNIYAESFPRHEQRARASQEKILSHPDYHFTCLCEEGRLLGILLYWQTEQFFYVEHFAVDPALRGKSVGSRALAMLEDSADRPTILEIDPLTTEIAVRRKGFYERLGFCANPYGHVHPPYHPDCAGHELIVMSRPASIGEETYRAFRDYLAHTVMDGVF